MDIFGEETIICLPQKVTFSKVIWPMSHYSEEPEPFLDPGLVSHELMFLMGNYSKGHPQDRDARL